ncbi:MAG: 3-keto-disaccharide hydrolase [Vicinamibacterales bacterium]
MLVRGMLLALVVAAGSAIMAQSGPVNTLTPAEKAAGWRLLFDGTSLDGWRGFKAQTAPAGWKAVDGALTRVDKAGDLITAGQFTDFELRLEWKLGKPGGNSGIFFHVLEEGGDQAYFTGPEVQVLDNAGHKDGADPKTSAGSNYALHAPVRDVTKPVGEWNEVRLVVQGPHVEHWMNGVKIVEYELWSPDWEGRVTASKFGKMPGYGRARTGHIAIQDHGDPVAFRNIKVRVLQPSSSRR